MKQQLLERKNMYTLIELMVTISVITILLTVLFPALRKAGAKARAISCVNNLKEYGGGIAQYIADYDACLPSHRTWYGTAADNYTAGLVPYVSGRLLGVPTDDEYSTGCLNCDFYNDKYLQPVTGWPSYYVRAYKPNPSSLYYALNPNDPERGTTKIFYKHPKTTRISSPSVAIYVFEMWTSYRYDIWNSSSDIPAVNSPPDEKGRGMLYADMHVGREDDYFKDSSVRNNRLRKIE